MRAALGAEDGKRARRIVLLALLALGAFMRLWRLGQVPAGIHQDEAFSAYEAYCLLEDGKDSWGYAFPVYFTAWGSGMNALGIYLMTPFVALFGLTAWAIRMPQAIVACLTLPAFYGAMKRLFDERTGLVALGVLAVCQWHILLARWGIESNLAPGFLIFGLYFMTRGMENPRFYPVSALFYGLSLYAYATIWVVVPVIVALEAALLLACGKMKPDRYMALSVLALGLLALPMVLYLLVNKGLIPEIRTPFFSIPRMQEARIDEVSLSDVAGNFGKMARMLLLQTDGELYNAPKGYGLYTFVAVPFIAVGAVSCVCRAARSLRRREMDGALFVLIQLLPALALGLLISGNIVRLNSLHMPVLMLETVGLVRTVDAFEKNRRRAGAVIAACYLAVFAGFAHHYFTDYAERVSITFRDGLGDAVARAKELAGEECPIALLGSIEFSRILFYDGTPPQAYRDTVTFKGSQRYLQAASFTRWRFGGAQEGDVIVANFDADLSGYADYAREDYGWITVLHR